MKNREYIKKIKRCFSFLMQSLIMMFLVLLVFSPVTAAHEWQSIVDTGEQGCGPVLRYDNGLLHMAYYRWWPANGSSDYSGVSYRKSTDRGAGWTDPKEIKHTTGTGDKQKNVSMAARNGKVIIAWLNIDYLNWNNLPVYASGSGDNGDSWSTPAIVTNQQAMCVNTRVRPGTAVDSSGNMYVTMWGGYSTDCYADNRRSCWIFSSSDNWQTRNREIRYLWSPLGALSDIAVCGDDLFLILDTLSWPGGNMTSSIGYTKRINNTWLVNGFDGYFAVNSRRVYYTPGASLWFWHSFADVEVENMDIIHIAYNKGDGWPLAYDKPGNRVYDSQAGVWLSTAAEYEDCRSVRSKIVYEKSIDGGTNWVTSMTLGSGYCPELEIDANNHLHLTYYSNTDFDSPSDDAWGVLKYTESQDGGSTWSPPVIIANNVSEPWNGTDLSDVQVPLVGKHSMAVTPDGQVMVAWRDNASPNHIKYRIKGTYSIAFIPFNTPDPDNHTTTTVKNNDSDYTYKNGETVDLLVKVSANATVLGDFSYLDTSSDAVSVTAHDNNDGTQNIQYAISLDNLYTGKDLPVTLKASLTGGSEQAIDKSFTLNLDNPIYSSKGGIYIIGDGTRIDIPVEAFDAEYIEMDVNVTGLTRTITPIEQALKKPADLSIPYTKTQLESAGLDEDNLGIYKKQGGLTLYIGGEKGTDTHGNTVLKTKIDSFGEYFIEAYNAAEGAIANFQLSSQLLSYSGTSQNDDSIVFSFNSNKSDNEIEIKIYSSVGILIKTLKNGQRTWFGDDEQGKRVKSGLYIYKVEAGEEYKAGKMVVIK